MKVTCPKCGFEDEGSFCSKCGSPLGQAVAAKKDVPRMTVEEVWTNRCPVCQSGRLCKGTMKKWLLTINTLECSNCGAAFSLFEAGKERGKYGLLRVDEGRVPVSLARQGQLHTSEELTRIANRGVYDPRQRDADIVEWMASLRDGKVSVTLTSEGASSPVVLKEGEQLQLVLPDMALWEARAIRTTSGGYGGATIRVARGVSLHGGSFGAQSSSYDDLTEVDHGRLTITNQRLVFTGARRTTDIKLTKIVSVAPYKEGIAVQASSRSKIQCFVGTDLGRMAAKVEVNERTYCEPITGLLLANMIDSLAKRQEETSKPSPRTPRAQRVAHGHDTAQHINELGKLRDSGLITAEEFEQKKKELLDRM